MEFYMEVGNHFSRNW